MMSVISLPDRDEALVQAVNQVWEHYLANVEELADLQYHRRKTPAVKAALQGHSDEEVFDYIQARKGGSSGEGPGKSVKQAGVLRGHIVPQRNSAGSQRESAGT